MSDKTTECPLMKTIIPLGLCWEIIDVGERLLKKEAVLEISGMDLDKIRETCRSCPYGKA